MRLTSGPAWDGQPAFSPDGKRIAFTSDRGGNENVWIMNADGSGAVAFTDDEDARCTEPFWDPAGPYLLYRRRTIDTRSIGVTEIWQRHLQGGDGFALTSKDEDPHAAEAFAAGRYVWFSSRHGRFEYDQSAVAGLWDVVRLNRRDGDERIVVHGPGSASRPMVSPDGGSLYFVSRERTDTLLERLDLRSGRRELLPTWLSPGRARDVRAARDLPGVRPDRRRGPRAVGEREALAARPGDSGRGGDPVPGPGDLDAARRDPLAGGSTHGRGAGDPLADTVVAGGSWAFSALGAVWVRSEKGTTTRIPSPGTGYAPAWSPDGTTLAWTSWDDETGGRLHVTGPNGKTEDLPVAGQLTDPAWSEDGERLVALRGGGGGLNDADLADERWYEIVLLERGRGQNWTERLVTAIDGQSGSRKTGLRVHEGRVWFFEFREDEPRKPDIAVLQVVALDGTDARDHLKLGPAEEVAIRRTSHGSSTSSGTSSTWPRCRRSRTILEVEAVPSRKVTRIVGDWLAFARRTGPRSPGSRGRRSAGSRSTRCGSRRTTRTRWSRTRDLSMPVG